MAKIEISALRREYRDMPLDESEIESDPVDQFQQWFEQAAEVELRDASALTLCTAGTDGQPSGRIVLLKGVGKDGFVFFTNYAGRKAAELEANPRAAMVFWWGELDRQVRVEGTVKRTSREESAAYFRTRPRASQISAVASPQSRVVADRSELVDAVRRLEAEYEGRDIPCPKWWGGYRLTPHRIEFWQGRPNRLHDRIRYDKAKSGDWVIERLGP